MRKQDCCFILTLEREGKVSLHLSKVMQSNQRATVAFLCGCINNQGAHRFTGIYDYSTSTNIACNYVKNGGNISVYDYRRGCYLSGNFPSFYDYGLSSYISITKTGSNAFSIYDYNSGNYAMITCNFPKVALYDYSEGRTYSYQIL